MVGAGLNKAVLGTEKVNVSYNPHYYHHMFIQINSKRGWKELKFSIRDVLAVEKSEVVPVPLRFIGREKEELQK